MKYLVITLLLFTTITASGQVDSALYQLQRYELHMMTALKKISFLTRSNREHFLYLEKSWQNSYAVTLDNRIINFNGRYNILNSGIEMQYEDQVRTIYPEQIRIAKIGKNTILPLRSNEAEDLEGITYFELLSNGKIKLLSRPFCRAVADDGNSLLPQVTAEKSYKIEADFYYAQGNDIRRLRSSRKKVLDLFGAKSEVMEAYLKDNHLRLNKQEDLVQLFDYYNAL
ncbi:MAG: hypothetical protein R2824_00670 [Saprospiraceae bacterium]